MEIITCPNCGVNILPTQGGQCPSCRKPLAIRTGKLNPCASSVPPVVMQPPGSVEPNAFADTSNPYLPPQIVLDDKSQTAPYSSNMDRGIIWVLFRFRGRIPRRTYWGWSLVSVALYYGCCAVLLTSLDENEELIGGAFAPLVFALYWVALALQAKRWHDRDKSGWWFLINFIPLIGPLISFVELGCLRGSYGPNRYGPDPT